MNEQLFMIITMFIGFILFTAAAFALFAVYKVLKKYADFGDSACKISEYSVGGVKYTRFGDDVPQSDKYHLFAEYGENPFENRRHRIPEVLLLNTQKDKQEDIDI